MAMASTGLRAAASVEVVVLEGEESVSLLVVVVTLHGALVVGKILQHHLKRTVGVKRS